MSTELDHWTQLALGEAWAAIARALEPDRPAAARVAWRRAAAGYEAYAEAYARNLPASRWDYDYGRETADARVRADAGVTAADRDAPLDGWVAAVLDGRFDDAVAAAPLTAHDDLARMVARVLAVVCVSRGHDADAARFTALAGAGAP